jgi:hypothetical protein
MNSLDVGSREEAQMHTLPPAANPLAPKFARSYLPPIRFRAKAFIKFCLTVDQGLAELEARYPARAPMLTIKGRAKRLKHRPK